MARLFRVALIALIGAAGVVAAAIAESVRNVAPSSLERPKEIAPPVDAGAGLRDPPPPPSPNGGPPALGNPNRGLGGYYRNTIGITPPGGRASPSGRF